jgi:hypothetical protein
MTKSDRNEKFLNGIFKDTLLIVIQKLSDRGLLSEVEESSINGKILDCNTLQVASAEIILRDNTSITFVYNDQKSFILSNIEKGKEFIPFSEKNLDRIITCLS